MSSTDRLYGPLVVTLVFHGAALGLLSTTDAPLSDDWDDETTVEIEPPPKPAPEPEPKIEPEPVKEPETEQVVEEVARVQPTNVEVRETRTALPITADEPDEETAGGDPDLPAPGGTFKMDDIVPGGTAMGGAGNSRSSGSGGNGSGDGSGGSGGEGSGRTKPVSIASIKAKAVPINNRDIIGDRRFNDVAGDVVVKLVVSEDGVVTKATLIRRLKPEVDEVALGWAEKLRFKPAIDQDDRPVASVVNWTFTFRPPT